MRLLRKVSFSSGHRYWRQELSEAENKELFGKWASPYNHGHNYVLWVGVDGSTDETTGMVVNIKDIDRTVRDTLLKELDQKSLNDEVAHFASVVPSTENLALYIAQGLARQSLGGRLTYLKLEENPLLFVEIDMNTTSPRVTLTRVYEFAASHRLHSPVLSQVENEALYGKCSNEHGHGHNYVLEVTVGGDPDPETGMLVGIGELDKVVHALVIDRYDHHNLSLEIPELQGKVATSEVVAEAIWELLDGNLPARLEAVRLFETARNAFEIRRPTLQVS
ncbi:MAG: 6-carboxytetrahydropterin synthase [Fimbriimonadaceae bacterium]